jgi:hypothetical protein
MSYVCELLLMLKIELAIETTRLASPCCPEASRESVNKAMVPAPPLASSDEALARTLKLGDVAMSRQKCGQSVALVDQVQTLAQLFARLEALEAAKALGAGSLPCWPARLR